MEISTFCKNHSEINSQAKTGNSIDSAQYISKLQLLLLFVYFNEQNDLNSLGNSGILQKPKKF